MAKRPAVGECRRFGNVLPAEPFLTPENWPPSQRNSCQPVIPALVREKRICSEKAEEDGFVRCSNDVATSATSGS